MWNILFSTTRQWNVGDEFILFGAISLLRELLPEGINPIIYNRHPDLRTEIQALPELRDIKLYSCDEQTNLVEANFRVGFRDNSFKRSTDGRFIDLVVFAGTPEWSNIRCLDLYRTIEEYNLPVIALGVGNGLQSQNEVILRNLERFQLFTVRAPELVGRLRTSIRAEPVYLPCPALCGAVPGTFRSVSSVRRIALIYACDVTRAELNNCVTEHTYQYLLTLYRKIICAYPDIQFSLVCHYIDELPFAHIDFPDIEILYSYDAKDYYEIYHRFDLVIGVRIHGIGCAASMGIPGIGIVHDFRGTTLQGFLADALTVDTPLDNATELISQAILSAAERSRQLEGHIAQTRENYLRLLRGAVHLKRSSFVNYRLSVALPVENVLERSPHLAESLRELLNIPNPQLVAKDEELAQQNAAIAARDAALAAKDIELAQQNAAIAARDAALAAKDVELAQQNAIIKAYDEAITEKDGRLARQEALAQEQRTELDEIHGSVVWKMTAPLRSVSARFKKTQRENTDR